MGKVSLRELHKARRAWVEVADSDDPEEFDTAWQAFKHAEAKAGFVKRFIVHLTGG